MAGARFANSSKELYNNQMEIVADASAFLAVVLNESDREWIVNKTIKAKLVAPEILPYEIGNAMMAMVKRGRLVGQEAIEAYGISQRIAVKLLPVRIQDAMQIAIRFNMYAYDAYYLQCCVERAAPLITLDARMRATAKILNINVVE
jgi:predicted nucleic acid-binding protein